MDCYIYNEIIMKKFVKKNSLDFKDYFGVLSFIGILGFGAYFFVYNAY